MGVECFFEKRKRKKENEIKTLYVLHPRKMRNHYTPLWIGVREIEKSQYHHLYPMTLWHIAKYGESWVALTYRCNQTFKYENTHHNYACMDMFVCVIRVNNL